MKVTKYRDVPDSSSTNEILYDLPKKEDVCWGSNVLKVAEVLNGDVLVLVTINFDELLLMKRKALMLSSLTINFSSQSVNLEIKHLNPRSHWRLSTIQSSDIVTSPAVFLVMKFGFQVQQLKTKFPYLILGRSYTGFLSKAK